MERRASAPALVSSSTPTPPLRPGRRDTKPTRFYRPLPRREALMTDQLRIVFVDNFDSFTWNLVDEFARRGAEVEVWRNTVGADLLLTQARRRPCLLVLSPGPGTPREAGCCIELVRRAAANDIPLFGVCL